MSSHNYRDNPTKTSMSSDYDSDAGDLENS